MMNRPLQDMFKLAALVLALTSNSFGQAKENPSAPPPAPKGSHWDLIWADEFDGNSLDLTKWDLPGDDVARSSGMWTNSQIDVSDGTLKFKVDRIDGKITSAGISSQNKFAVTEGYFEMRAMLPRTPGYRPAFWLSSVNINEIGYPTHPTEVDVMEDTQRNGHVTENLHWNGYGPAEGSVGSVSSVETPPNEFHIYGVWWNIHGYFFYVDSVPVWGSTGGGVSSGPEFIRLGNEMLGQEQLVDGQPVNVFPTDDYFTVDYIRVFQLR
jgi:beta-glucanase (GH16 family)